MKYTLFIVFGFFNLSSYSDDSTVVAIIMIDRLDFDFGELLQGEKKSHTFKVKNIGTSPLIISDVHTQCGCTAVKYPKEPIMPGKSADLIIKYDSSNKLGMQRKVVTIISNAPEVVKIRILAHVYVEED
jgi:hypothetical protein